MRRIHRFSTRVIDYAERLSNIADAAEGKRRKDKKSRWFVLPAAGAAVYAVARSDFVSRRAVGVAHEARTLASELPDDLMARVQQTSAGTTSAGNGRRQSSSSRRKTAGRSRRTASSSRTKSRAAR